MLHLHVCTSLIGRILAAWNFASWFLVYLDFLIEKIFDKNRKMTEAKGLKGKKNLEFIALDQTQQDALSKKMKKIKKKKKEPDVFDSNERGVIFIKRLPHGFFEPQLRRYFEQFGTVTRLRLSRSKRTGRSKCYAYIEFECKAVAKVAAETMNNYLMFEHILKCELLSESDLHPETFKGCDRVFYKPCTRKRAIIAYNTPNMDPKNVHKRELRKKKSLNKLKNKLHNLGVDLDFSNFGVKKDWVAPKRKLAKTGEKTLNKTEPLDVSTEMLVDLDDDEIKFKTPPKSAKVRTRSVHLSKRDQSANHHGDQAKSTNQNKETEVSTNEKKEEKSLTNHVKVKGVSTNQIKEESISTNQSGLLGATPKRKRKIESVSKSVKKSSRKSLLEKRRALMNKTL
uniref:MKI67 FHA domain-interacting nucleolar phosphoprotein-like n=1 Tax=Phallusia mammillata TaxID=59560 RepID=A0A6F9DK69_9ASCI|nr:MKI67 FHA domain-interacting nucleolar phosphoprotein-like [Phallusia mammillata]